MLYMLFYFHSRNSISIENPFKLQKKKRNNVKFFSISYRTFILRFIPLPYQYLLKEFVKW